MLGATKRVATVLFAVGMLAACSNSKPAHTPTETTSHDMRHMGGSHVKTYGSPAEVDADSPVIIEGRVVSSTSYDDVQLPATVSTVQVSKVVKGTVGDTVRVQQFGTSSVQFDDGAAPLQKGKSYRLDLYAAQAPASVTHGAGWFITGGVGVTEL